MLVVEHEPSLVASGSLYPAKASILWLGPPPPRPKRSLVESHRPLSSSTAALAPQVLWTRGVASGAAALQPLGALVPIPETRPGELHLALALVGVPETSPGELHLALELVCVPGPRG